MTTDERIELLKKVWDASPERWKGNCSCVTGDVIRWDVPQEGFEPPVVQVYLRLGGVGVPPQTLDRWNAEACFLMLDAIEKAGWDVQLDTGYECIVYKLEPVGPIEHFRGGGPTRATAIAKAFVAVFSTGKTPEEGRGKDGIASHEKQEESRG